MFTCICEVFKLHALVNINYNTGVDLTGTFQLLIFFSKGACVKIYHIGCYDCKNLCMHQGFYRILSDFFYSRLINKYCNVIPVHTFFIPSTKMRQTLDIYTIMMNMSQHNNDEYVNILKMSTVSLC